MKSLDFYQKISYISITKNVVNNKQTYIFLKMSEQKNALAAMLEQYEANAKPKYEKKPEKVYDLKNYFNTYIPDGVKSATKTIRILPVESGSPFVEIYAHKIQIDGEYKTFACLKEEKDEPCPFCEAREALLSTGNAEDKKLAGNYKARLMYVVKVIDRANEDDGVKFWRFNHDSRSEGIYDKIYAVINALRKDITHAETGRDIMLTINRNQNNVPVVSGIATLDPTPLSEDAEKMALWLSDKRTWEDVYSVRSYDYLAIIVKGGTPVWDKENKCFVDKKMIDAVETEKQTLDSELTLGVETVKANMQAASEPTTVTEVSAAEEEDDLPF